MPASSVYSPTHSMCTLGLFLSAALFETSRSDSQILLPVLEGMERVCTLLRHLRLISMVQIYFAFVFVASLLTLHSSLSPDSESLERKWAEEDRAQRAEFAQESMLVQQERQRFRDDQERLWRDKMSRARQEEEDTQAIESMMKNLLWRVQYFFHLADKKHVFVPRVCSFFFFLCLFFIDRVLPVFFTRLR